MIAMLSALPDFVIQRGVEALKFLITIILTFSVVSLVFGVCFIFCHT